MSGFRVQHSAGHRLDEIYVYTSDQWDEAQAERYIRGMFACFEAIAAGVWGATDQ
jgi:toxin ParE1/3/4